MTHIHTNPGATQRQGGGAPPGFDALQHRVDYGSIKRPTPEMPCVKRMDGKQAMNSQHVVVCERSKMSVPALSALRQELARQGLDGFIVPRADEHLGEYVPAAAERLAWLTGFTGSAGLAVVLAETAAVFTDGRYVLQLAEQTDPDAGSGCISPRNRRQPGWPSTRRRRPHRLRPAADQRGRPRPLHRRRPGYGGGGAQSDRCGLDRPAGAAERPCPAASAWPTRAGHRRTSAPTSRSCCGTRSRTRRC